MVPLHHTAVHLFQFDFRPVSLSTANVVYINRIWSISRNCTSVIWEEEATEFYFFGKKNQEHIRKGNPNEFHAEMRTLAGYVLNIEKPQQKIFDCSKKAG